MSQGTSYRELQTRLSAVRRKLELSALARGAALAALVLIAGFLLAVLAESQWYLPSAGRAAVLALVGAAGAGVFMKYAGQAVLQALRLQPPIPDDDVARRVGKAFPEVHDRLVNILQLVRENDGTQRGKYHSGELVDAAFEEFSRDTASLDLTSAVTYARAWRTTRFALLAAVAALFFFLAAPGALLGSAYRLWHFGEAFAAPMPFRLFVSPGNAELLKGGTMVIAVRAEGNAPDHVVVSATPEGQTLPDDHQITPAVDGTYRLTLSDVQSSFRYVARCGDVCSDEYVVSVIDRPSISLLRLVVQPPGYAGLPVQPLDDNVGDVSALPGSHVHIELTATKDISSAQAVFSDSTSLDLQVARRTASGTMTLKKALTYHLTVADRTGIRNTDPIDYTINPVADAYPAVTVLAPAANIDVTDKDVVRLVMKVSDDFGFTSLRLAYRLDQSQYDQPSTAYTTIPIPLPPGTHTEAVVTFAWPLAPLHLAPEDVVGYYVEVFDNDNVSGPKSSASERYTLRLPSLNEVFADVDKEHAVSLEGLEASRKQAEEAKTDLEELKREVRNGQQKMDWQDQKKSEQLLKKYEALQKRMEDVQQTLEKMTGDMSKDQVLSKETMEKYLELQQVMEQMNSPEFAEAMKQIQQAMQAMNPEAMRQALDKFSFSEEAFRKSIDRTLNLLKRVQVEQKIDQAMRRAEQLQQGQEEVKKETAQSAAADQKSTQELAKKQEGLGRDAEQLVKELKDLQKKMEEFPGEMPLAQMEELNRQIQQDQAAQLMNESARQIAEGKQEQASAQQDRAAKQMGGYLKQLQSLKQSLQQGQQQQVMNGMRRSLQDLVELSKREEALKDGARTLAENTSGFRENAEQQMEILRGLSQVMNQMSSLSQKTFSITPEMGQQLGDAARSMGDAMKSLDQRSGGGAAEKEGQAMASLNGAAALVDGALQAMSKGGGQGMGMAGFMQKMKQLSGMQEGINQGTKDLQGMTADQAAAMARLAGEQGVVRKSLEQLQREAASSGELQKMLGDLSRAVQEMREVQTDLAQENVSSTTMKTQDRILSRLLDAQRSTQERDYEQKRKSAAGANVARSGPAELDAARQNTRDARRRELLRLFEQGYARDYEELIRKYFNALDQQDVRSATPSTKTTGTEQ